MKTYNSLRARLRAFVRAYVETGVGTKAMRVIGFKGTRADVAAAKLLAKPRVREAVEEFEASMQDEVKRRIYANLRGLEQIANWDPIWLAKPLEDWPEEVRATIQGIDVEDLFEGFGKEREQIGHVRKYRIASKIEARKLIMQYQRVLVEKHEHSGPDGGPIQLQDVDTLTDKQLEAIARRGGPTPAEPEKGEG